MPGHSAAGAPAPDADTLAAWLLFRAAASPDRIALAAGKTWTYAQLDADATTLARRMQQLGLRPGDRIASLLHNSPGAVVLVHAALRLGATLVPLNIRLRDVEVAWQLSNSGATLLISEDRTSSLARLATRELPDVGVITLTGEAAGGIALGDRETAAGGSGPGMLGQFGAVNVPVAATVTPDTDATPLRLVHPAAAVLAIIYTSGTTGQPKGAQLTVGNFWWSAIGSALNLGAHAGDRWLAVLPLFHVGGLSIVLRAAIHGMTVVLHDSFDERRANQAIDDEGVTIVSVVGVMLQRMLDARNDRAYPPSLRCVLLGGGPAPMPLLDRSAAAGVPVVQTYGLTEACSQVATLAPDDASRKRGAAGRVLYPNALRIESPDGSTAGVGQPGEILVRGPIVMAGYAGAPGATTRAISDGWLHTGDIGSIDAEGFLFVHDRRDDLIITGGENVYPAEIEAALLSHPWVAEAGVIGVPDDRWGQRVVGVVRLEELAQGEMSEAPEMLRAHCRALLGGFKVPSEVRIAREPLPRTASGKLQRSALRDGA